MRRPNRVGTDNNKNSNGGPSLLVYVTHYYSRFCSLEGQIDSGGGHCLSYVNELL